MFLDDMAVKFVAAGIGTLDTTLFIGLMPSRPPAVVALIETPGLPPVRTMRNSGTPDLENVGLQVIVRDTPDNYDVARIKANDVWRLIGSSGAETINSVRYLSFEAISSVFNIGPDDEDRVQLVGNYLIWKEPTP